MTCTRLLVSVGALGTMVAACAGQEGKWAPGPGDRTKAARCPRRAAMVDQHQDPERRGDEHGRRTEHRKRWRDQHGEAPGTGGASGTGGQSATGGAGGTGGGGAPTGDGEPSP